MHDTKTKDLAKYRLEKSAESLNEAHILFDNESYVGCINRSYYSIFYAMRAVLALDNTDFRRHSGVISGFQKEYIKSGIFDKSCSDIIESAFRIRNKSDYDDFFVISKEDTKNQLNNADEFYALINEFIKDVD